MNNAVGASSRDALARDMPVIVFREAAAAAPAEPAPKTYLEILVQWTAQVTDLTTIDQLLNGVSR